MPADEPDDLPGGGATHDLPRQATIADRLLGAYDAIGEELPVFISTVERSLAALRRYEHHVYDNLEDHPISGPTIFGQICNDLVDLLLALSSGQGRTAIRAARSVFELVVADQDVRADSDADERYDLHRVVVAYQQATVPLGEELLPDDLRRQLVAARTRMQSALEPTHRALVDPGRYGRDFRSGWAKRNLRQRAATHGLDRFYPYFKLASGVLHGGPAGGHGIEAEVEGHHIIRTGLALGLCPVAYLFGVQVIKEWLRLRAERDGDQITLDELRSAVDDLEQQWPAYTRSITLLDLSVWPDSPPGPGTQAVLVLARSGAETWFAWDTHAEQVAPANVPHLTEAQRSELEKVRLATVTLWHSAEVDEVVLIITGVKITAERHATWRGSSTLWPAGVRVAVVLG